MAPAAAAAPVPVPAGPAPLTDAEKARLRVGALVDHDFRSWLLPRLPDHPATVEIRGRLAASFPSPVTPAESTEARTIFGTLGELLVVTLRFFVRCVDALVPNAVSALCATVVDAAALAPRPVGSLDLVGTPGRLTCARETRRMQAGPATWSFDPWHDVAREQTLVGVDVKVHLSLKTYQKETQERRDERF